MSLLALQEVHKFYGRQDVLKGVSFSLGPGERAGLIGANGAGKTTLLRIILSREAPDYGQVHQAKGLRLGYLPQDLMSFTGQTLLELVMDTAADLRAVESELKWINLDIEDLAAQNHPDPDRLTELTDRQSRLLELFENLGGYSLEADAKKILAGLGFTETDFHRMIDEFSGGWTMRAVLARLLLAEPDILLLDEPTNHLDMDSLLWLENYLQTCPSSLLLVSHDRVFLNNVVTRLLEVDRGRIYNYNGNYDRYLEEKDKRLALEASNYANQQEKIKQVERFIEKNRVRKDRAKQVQSRIKMLEKMDKFEAPQSPGETMKFALPPAARGPELLVQLSDVTKAYGTNVVYRDLDFSVRRGDRLALLGPNGRGKSTLLKLVAGMTDYQAGVRRVGDNVFISYFAQFQLEELNPNHTVLEEIQAVAGHLTTGRLRTVLGNFLFHGDDVFKKVSVLSGGEKSRLILAKIMLAGPNLLLLDEPTNHLDIPGRDLLEQALRQYDGTLVLISHDRHLINAVANKVALIEPGGGVDTFLGDFEDFLRIWKDRLEQEAAASESKAVERAAAPSKSPGQSLTRAEKEAKKRAEAEARQRLYKQKAPLVKQVEQLEASQAELGIRLDRLSAELADPETYQEADRAKQLNQAYADTKTELERVTEAWEEAALKLEEIEDLEQSES